MGSQVALTFLTCLRFSVGTSFAGTSIGAYATGARNGDLSARLRLRKLTVPSNPLSVPPATDLPDKAVSIFRSRLRYPVVWTAPGLLPSRDWDLDADDEE